MLLGRVKDNTPPAKHLRYLGVSTVPVVTQAFLAPTVQVFPSPAASSTIYRNAPPLPSPSYEPLSRQIEIGTSSP